MRPVFCVVAIIRLILVKNVTGRLVQRYRGARIDACAEAPTALAHVAGITRSRKTVPAAARIVTTATREAAMDVLPNA